MRNISFFLTTPQFLDGSKDVTRRTGWKNVRVGELLQAVVKGQGIPKGGKVEKLGVIRVKEANREPLNFMLKDSDYGQTECEREGFSTYTPKDFVEMFCRHNHWKPGTVITRIAFEHVK